MIETPKGSAQKYDYDPDSHFLAELEEFFVDYNKLEGKEFKALKQMDAKEASKLIDVDE